MTAFTHHVCPSPQCTVHCGRVCCTFPHRLCHVVPACSSVLCLCLVALSRCRCVQASSGWGERRPLSTSFSLRWLLLLQSTGSKGVGFSSCSTWAQKLWCMGLVALSHVGSSRTREQTCVPCIGRRILIHCPFSFQFSRSVLSDCL